MQTALVDVLRVFLVGRNADRPHDLAMHHLPKTDDRIERGTQFVAHIGEEHRFGVVGFGQLDGPFLDTGFQGRVQLAQLGFRPLLCGVTRSQGVCHGVEGCSQMADFRRGVANINPRIIVAVAPFRRELHETAYRLLQEPAPAEDRRKGCREQTENDQRDAAGRRAVDCREGFRFRLSGAEKEIPRRQGCRNIAEYSRCAVDADGLFPARCVAVHDRLMAFSHILADQGLGVRKSRNNIALAIGDQDRGCGGQTSLFQMFREPAQIETGENDAGRVAVAAIEFQRKMDHARATRRIGPVIADGEPVLRHCPLEERLVGNRGIAQRTARAKNPAVGIRRCQQTIVSILRRQ